MTMDGLVINGGARLLQSHLHGVGKTGRKMIVNTLIV